MSGPRKFGAFLIIAYLAVHVGLLAYVAIPSIFSDLSADAGPGRMYNAIITSELRIDRVFYFAIAPIFAVISLATFWDTQMTRPRWTVLGLCLFGLAMAIVLYFGFAVLNGQNDLWQLASLEKIRSFSRFSALTTQFVIQNCVVFVAILLFAAGATKVSDWARKFGFGRGNNNE